MTSEEIQAKLDDLRAEAEALPDAIRQCIAAGGDGKKMAALVARRDVLSVVIVQAEVEMLEAQIAARESELPSLRSEARIMRDKAIQAHDEVVAAKQRANVIGGESLKAADRVKDLAQKIRDGRDRLFLLRRESDRALEAKASPHGGLRPRL